MRSTIGNAYRRLGAPERALTHLQFVLDYHQQQRADPGLIAQDYTNLAWNVAALGKYDEAARLATRATELHAGNRTVAAVEALWCLQHCLIYKQDFQSADQVAQRALDAAQAIEPAPPQLANILHDLAQSKTRQGKPNEGVELARRAIAIHEASHGDTHPETGWGYEALGRALTAAGNHRQAVEAFEQAIAIFETKYPQRHKSVRMTREQLELAARSAGDTAHLKQLQQERVRNLLEPIFFAQESPDGSLLNWLQKKQHYLAAGELIMLLPSAFETTGDAIIALKLLDQYRQDVDKQWGELPEKKLEKWRAAVNELVNKAAANCPDDANSLNSVAWLAVVSSDAAVRQAALGVDLAERATRLDDQKGAYWNTLGLAYLRAERTEEAVTALQRSQSFDTTDEYDTVMLAIAYARLSQPSKARENLEAAKLQYHKRGQKNAELEPFLAEAESLLNASPLP